MVEATWRGGSHHSPDIQQPSRGISLLTTIIVPILEDRHRHPLLHGMGNMKSTMAPTLLMLLRGEQPIHQDRIMRRRLIVALLHMGTLAMAVLILLAING